MLVMMDRIENYYGLAVHNNHDLKSVQNAIWAIYHHVIKDNNLASDEQHKICPNSADSWCKYGIDTINGIKTYSEERDSVNFKEELKPTFERLPNAELPYILDLSPTLEYDPPPPPRISPSVKFSDCI